MSYNYDDFEYPMKTTNQEIIEAELAVMKQIIGDNLVCACRELKMLYNGVDFNPRIISSASKKLKDPFFAESKRKTVSDYIHKLAIQFVIDNH